VDAVILDNTPFQIDLDDLMRTLHVKAHGKNARELERLAQAAQAIGKPKAMYKVAYIESKGEDTIATDSVVFTSRVLRVNLEQAHKMFPYVATCGTELEEWALSMQDLLQRFWAEAVNEWALRSTMRFLEKHLVEQFGLGQISRMSPGSLEDWPLREQRALFALLGDPQAAIGVRLMDSLLMVPTKSVSGIWFPTLESFASCQLCPRENCRGRRAPYDKGLYDRKYRADSEQATHYRTLFMNE
jgi:hypothetical protein